MLEDREKAAERNFVNRQELAFKIKARRNLLLGLWAAGHMGLTGDGAQRYAQTVVDAELTGHDDSVLVKKVFDDLVAAGAPLTEGAIRDHLRVVHAMAVNEVAGDPGDDGPASSP
jgi:hypothetical protein